MASKPLTQSERKRAKTPNLARNFKAKQVSYLGYEIYKDKLVGICGFDGCNFYGGFLNLPMCEDHAWLAFEALKNDVSESEAKERARQQWVEWEEEERKANEARELEYAERWKNQTTIEAGYIYYLLVGDLIKIGYTRSMTDRMKAYPPNSKLLATHPGTLKVEKQMHHKFLHLLSRGREWFTPTDELMDHIDKVTKDFKQNHLVAA